jgi:mono/diheme cytochrome c family protein
MKRPSVDREAWFFTWLALVLALAAGPVTAQTNIGLVFDAEQKEYNAKPGEITSHFVFAVTNTSAGEVTINNVRPSCGCTVVKLPSQPWKLNAGERGEFAVDMDLRGKSGVLMKSVSVEATTGVKHLIIKTVIPSVTGMSPDLAERVRNQQLALADRQAVFKGECVLCHVQPAVDKLGGELYTAACGICHDSTHRATMVPDLRALNKPTDEAYWTTWITQGKPGSLMPAFAQNMGGPLTDEQIKSLVQHLVTRPEVAPPAAVTAPVAAPAPQPRVTILNPKKPGE